MADHAISDDAEKWDVTIDAGRSGFDLNLKEIWRYRDLMMMFVKKDIITVYKQTILGPIWFLLQPIFATAIYVIIFSHVAKISTGNAPPILFYLGGITMWNYFSETLNVSSKTFTDNATVFGKVYFPRIVLPLSKVVSGIVKLMIQFGLYLSVWLYYLAVKHEISPNWHIVFFPAFIVILAGLSLGMGIIITSFTTKYRDLTFFIAFAIQLGMYATPVLYPISIAPANKQFWLWLNPLTSIVEGFRCAFLGSGVFSYFWLSYSLLFMIIALITGIIVFNKVEKRFIDTV
jgi:lipopolysaccharide transport system permease protein